MIHETKFNLRELNRLYEDRGYDEKTGQKKDYLDAKNYLKSRLFPLNNSDYILNEKGSLTRISYETVSRTIFPRLPDELKKWYVKKNYDLYEQVCKLNQPIFTEDEINTVGRFKHRKYKPYDEYPKNIKYGVNMMLDFYREIWCSDNKESYNYVLSWLANVVQGGKNETILYLKSNLKGIGKSRGSTFMIDYVIGNALSKESPSMPLTSAYNLSLFGKVLIVFEELENSSKYEWEAISSRLKTWATSDKITYTEKYMKSFESNNINNYIINTNNEAIKGADGRRYMCLDVSSKRYQDEKYWVNLHKTCFNDEIGEAFYSYLLERDISNFNNRVCPLTQNKKDALINLLNPVYKFIKFNFIMCDKPINTQTKELYEQYITYCQKTEQRESKKRKFISLLREVGITYKTKNSKCIINYSCEQLKEIADKFKWMFDDDSEEFIDNCIWKESTNIINSESKKEKDQRILFLEQENERLKQDMQKLKKALEETRNKINFFTNTPNNSANDAESAESSESEEEPQNIIISESEQLLIDFDSF
jgi:hypothetical protein